MVRSPSVASADSGAESYDYAAEPASAGGGAITHNRLSALGVPHYAPGDGLIGSAHPAMLSAPPVTIGVAPGNATREITVIANRPLPEQVGIDVLRLSKTYDTPVIDQQSGRWYVRDIRASTQPMGTQ